MRSVGYKAIIVFLTVCLALGSLNLYPAKAENSIPLSAFGNSYLQDFNTLSNNSPSDLLPTGWVILETGSGANVDNKYQASNGNMTVGDTYSFGSENSTDRALGSIQDVNLVPLFGASFTNQTGGVIQSLSIKYTGEEWRLSKSGRSDKLYFELSTNATTLENGSWTEYEALTFGTPYRDTEGAKNGNLSAYRTNKQLVITGLSIASGKTFWIRWRDHKDTSGKNDGLAVDDFSLVAYGVDDPPTLTGFTPADKEIMVALDANLSFTFSEPVTLADGWMSVSCSISQLHEVSVSGGPKIFEIDPMVDFVNGDICSVTILASKVSDQDSTDPPDTLDKDYSFSFSVIPPPDAAPLVIKTTPANNESEVLLNSSLTVQFSESVAVTPGWFTLVCTLSGIHGASVDGGPSTFFLTPQNAFWYDENCSLTIKAPNISDLDVDDPFDNMPADITTSFDTLRTPDSAPYLSSSTPSNNSVSIPINQIFELTFSEPVFMDPKTPTLSCESGDVFSLTITEGPMTFKVKPDRPLNYADSCSITLSALLITDKDETDPPDNLIMDQIINFKTTAKPIPPPIVTQVVPAEGVVNIAVNSDISISFNEKVVVTNSWAGLRCTVSGEHSYETSGTSQNKIVNPDLDFANNETCTLTIYASQVKSEESENAEVFMAEDYSMSFTTALAEKKFNIETNPADHAVDVPVDKSIAITFSEPVTILKDGISLTCSSSGLIPLTREQNSKIFNFYFENDLKYSEECSVTLKADKVFYLEPEGQPVFTSGDFTISFTTVKNGEIPPGPAIVSNENLTPHDSQILNESVNHLMLQFSKDVLHNGSHTVTDYTNNYGLYYWGANREFNTSTCGTPGGDDQQITIDEIIYDPTTFRADLSINYGQNIPEGTYRLIICGGNAITDQFGTVLSDTSITFTISTSDNTSSPNADQNTGNNGGNGSSNQTTGSNTSETDANTSKNNTAQAIPLIPVTGFPRGLVTHLAPQLTAYTDLGTQWLEIPDLGMETSITGVPKENNYWDVSWLGNKAGWLEGSAQLGNLGNTVLTAHVWDALNKPGPFYGLEKLNYGDQVILHAWGDEYIYEVREVLSVKPENVNAMMKHQEKAWLTLVTCQGYDEESGEYQHRILVRAVLMEVR